MPIRDLWEDELMRLRILLLAMLTVFALLLAALWRMQVAHGKHYQSDLVRQSVRRVRIPGLRGKIVDRNGVCMADNRPSYCVAFYLEELRRPGKWIRTIEAVEKEMDEVAQVLGLPPQISREDIQAHIKKRLPLPLVAWKDMDEKTLARLAEGAAMMPGVDIHIEAVRVYPLGSMACHAVGYVGRADPLPDGELEEEEPYHYYLPEMAGKAGVEKKFDDVLRGEAGGRLVRVDVSGFRHDDLGQREPRNGHTVRLSLDTRIQRLAEEALRGYRGAAVVVDPRNGDVLALASAPGFDLNGFIPSISRAEWDRLSGNPEHPLMSRSTAGAYPPGSIFKPVVALAALESGKAVAQTAFSCPGYFELGKSRFRCWYRPGHGLVNLQQAIRHSCNVYFFHLGLQCGYEAVYRMALALGLGVKTGIALDYEVAGLMPDDGWKRTTQGDGWRDGDTCNISIGQGYLLVTPLQMALFAATLANGGTLYVPRLVMSVERSDGGVDRAFPPQVANRLNWQAGNIAVVRRGMLDVVEAPDGTGKFAAIPGVHVAGKTGTAEYGKKEDGLKLGWMIAFAPFEKPEYAIALMVEDALSGGTTTAPLMQKLLMGLFQGVDNEEKGEG